MSRFRSRASTVLQHPFAFAIRVLRGFRANQGYLLAGAVAYNTLLSILPLLILVRDLGLLDNPLGLALPEAAFALPLTIYTLSAFFREIPWDLEKAAKMDGATPFQAFTKVIAPLAAPVATPEPKARWTGATFADLPGWRADDLRDVRTAFAYSKNTVAAQLGNEVGVRSTVGLELARPSR